MRYPEMTLLSWSFELSSDAGLVSTLLPSLAEFFGFNSPHSVRNRNIGTLSTLVNNHDPYGTTHLVAEPLQPEPLAR